MARLPVLKPKKVLAALERAGFIIIRRKGSHVHLRHPEKAGLVTVPMHNRDMLPKTLRTIIEKQAEMTVEEFTKLL